MRKSTLICAAIATACTQGGGAEGTSSFSGTDATSGETATGASDSVTASTTAATGTSTTSPTGSSTSTDTDDVKFDLPQGDDVPDMPPPSCKVVDDMDAVPPCMQTAPPDSFDPEVQWSFTVPLADNTSDDSVVTPLVANLTDDNADNEIDLCDTPDIVHIAGNLYDLDADRLYVLDGATGAIHWKSEAEVSINIPPALGDIDDDGIPEILVGISGGIRAYEHDGFVKWDSETFSLAQAGSIALADVDNDGDVEISAGPALLDHEGKLLWEIAGEAESYMLPAATLVDLDGDDDLEIVFGRTAVHHDQSIYYQDLTISPGFSQVADFDDDMEPEILIVNKQGLTLLEANGAVIYKDENPTNVNVNTGGFGPWLRPAAVHDFDGDGSAEFAVSSLDVYAVYEPMPPVANWTASVLDSSGRASGTAFDFLGDGKADAIYADETTLFVFDDGGGTLMSVPRSSPTQIEYPIVADVDNDQSAEIVVVSSSYQQNPTAPSLQVIRDKDDRWIPARRIWNQHTYHVTNVREDGTIPMVEPKHWKGLNTFRTQAQFEAGGVCQPEG